MPSAKPSLKAMAKEAKDKSKSASTKAKKTSKSIPVAPNHKSTEFVQDSDDEGVDNNEVSEDESDSDDESLPENPTENARKTAKLPAPSGSSSSSENESSSSESSEDEEELNNALEPAVQAEPSRPREKESNPRIVTFAKPSYTPPSGFENTTIVDGSSASQLLKKSGLKGKQIWYFTAPSSIPISEIEQISTADADTGKEVLSYEGGNYGFVQDTTGEKSYTQIMVPSSSNGAYLTASKSIDRVLHLQQIVKLPGINDGDATATPSSQATVPAKKPVRQQPKGLRMRFRPIGFGTGKLGKLGSSSSDDSSESDEEMEEASAVFQRHVLADAADEEDSTSSDEEMEDAPPIKPKKSKIKDSQAKSSPLKRKHLDDQPVIKSSSQPISIFDNNQLNKLKKKQEKLHTSSTESPSASTEPNGTSRKPLFKKAKHTVQTSIPNLPNASHPSIMKVNQESESPSHKHSKKRSHESERTQGKKHNVSLHELTKATNPNLTGEERRKKMKKSKHKVPK